jgi:serine/threonine-protein kinase
VNEPERIGRYRVERVLGRGAMGVVYQAHDPDIDRRVAIKLVRADLLDGADRADYLQRFRREAQAAGRCTHPNIVTLYDFAMHGENPFLAMQFIDGPSLNEHCERHVAMPPADAAAIMLPVLDALEAAHALGIVHRDIKPANILLERLRSGSRVKVTDFGIARLEGAGLTQDGSVIGTPSYMSPEQCLGDPVDGRGDLFSAGAVLYQLVCGERPFAGRNITEVTQRVLHAEPPDIAVLAPGVPAALKAVIDRALAKSAAARFPSAAAMADALRESVSDGATILMPAGAATGQTTRLAPPDRSEATMRGRPAASLVQTASAIAPPALAPDELERAQKALAHFIGPMARLLVGRAAPLATSPADLWQRLSLHIDRAADRAAFLGKRQP